VRNLLKSYRPELTLARLADAARLRGRSEVLDVIERDDLAANAQRLGDFLSVNCDRLRKNIRRFCATCVALD